jgi:hypothetical protein
MFCIYLVLINYLVLVGVMVGVEPGSCVRGGVGLLTRVGVGVTLIAGVGVEVGLLETTGVGVGLLIGVGEAVTDVGRAVKYNPVILKPEAIVSVRSAWISNL